MKVKIIESVRHDNNDLKLYENYDLDEAIAKELIRLKVAEAVDADSPARPQPEPQAPTTPKYDADKHGFVAQAKLTQEELEKIKAEGKEDPRPVTGSKEVDTTPEPTVAPVVVGEDGKPLTDEQVKEQERAAAAAAAAKDAADKSLNIPTK